MMALKISSSLLVSGEFISDRDFNTFVLLLHYLKLFDCLITLNLRCGSRRRGGILKDKCLKVFSSFHSDYFFLAKLNKKIQKN